MSEAPSASSASSASPTKGFPTSRGAELRAMLEQGALVLDGAMGTQLYERGILYSACFEELNVSRPELVRRVHEDYLRAGAQVIETNTFGANSMRLEKHGFSARVRELNHAAVHLAREAAESFLAQKPGAPPPFVAGAVGPSGYFLGDAIEADLVKVKAALREQADALVEAKVDLIILETIRQREELRVAIQAASEATHGTSIPILACVSLDENGRMADGTGARDVAEEMKLLGAHAVGVNCSDGPQHVLASVEQMLPVGIPVCAVPNAGLPHRVDERLVYVSTPEYFGVYARRLFKLGVRMVGGCCGTTPEHVRRIAAAARMAGASAHDSEADLSVYSSHEHDSVRVEAATVTGVSAVPFPEKSRLASKIGHEFVVSVEVNPPIGLDPSKAVAAARMLKAGAPIGLDPSKAVAAARMLKAGGVHVINIADGARAQARMSNLAMAARIQRDVGMETILHVCGRDRNLLATLAHLLGAHDLGLKNLVIITGDPPKMGDFPDASPVYDLDSIGMLKLASRLNHGIDPAGKPLGGVTSFLLATGAEPAALNYPREIARLRQKKEAGAEIVMTQPVYDPKVLERFLDDIAPLGLPVLVGLLPLASHRNAEFLHNEVPGMQVPEAVRERMHKAGGGAAGRKEGVAIAREMLSAVRDKVVGAYIMPPLERYDLALEVIDGFLGPVGKAASASR